MNNPIQREKEQFLRDKKRTNRIFKKVMKLNTKKTEGECKCVCHLKGSTHGTICPGCQPTEKPMDKWEMEGFCNKCSRYFVDITQHNCPNMVKFVSKYKAIAEYKQKLIKKKEELRKEGFDSGCDDAGCPCSKIQFTDYDRGFNDCLDEVEAVIKDL
jgi:hypothetical protein